MHLRPPARRLLPRGAAIVASCLIAAGCGGSSAPRTFTAHQVADKLSSLGCSAKPPDTTDTIDLGDIKPKASLECTINGEDIGIDEYATADQVKHNLNLAKGIGCEIAKEFGVSEAFYVLANNVMVTPDTRSTAEQVKNAIGGPATVHTLHC